MQHEPAKTVYLASEPPHPNSIPSAVLPSPSPLSTSTFISLTLTISNVTNRLDHLAKSSLTSRKPDAPLHLPSKHTSIPPAMKRRKKPQKREAKDPKDRKDPTDPKEAKDAPDPQKEVGIVATLRFIRNCCLIACAVTIPYCCMLAYTWFHLHSGITRPVVHLGDTRQVMIFGMQSSGTSAMSTDLMAKGAEIGHECTDAMDAFVRDGTLSWAHAIQALSGDANIGLLCEKPRFQLTHSTQFEAANCSYRVKWNKCWAKECVRVFTANYGCLERGDCPTPFRRYMVQVRHPLKTIASLVVKYCERATAGTLPHEDVLVMLASFYPEVAWSKFKGGCKEVFAHYWLQFYSALHPSRNKFVDSYYRIEDTDPCTVLKMAGFMSPSSGAYGPSVEAVQRNCAEALAKKSDVLMKLQDNSERKEPRSPRNEVNKGRVRVTRKDLERIDPKLLASVNKLAKEYGYDEL